jgi:ribosome biogenesis protein Nip4
LENLKERKRPLRRPRQLWEDNIRLDVREIGWESVDWMHLAKDRDQWQAVVNTVMKFHD